MKKIVILSTDTAHHRYFINKIINSGIKISALIFETTHVNAKFETLPFYEEEEKKYENIFFDNIKYNLDENLYLVENINDCKSIEYIKNISPDFGILFGTRKVSDELISIFKDGLINVHRGISEKYRGVDSELWAIYHNDYKNIGVTIHEVDANLDTGKIIFQEKLSLNKKMKIYQLRYYTSLLATDLTINAINDYLSFSLKTFSQKQKGRYYSFMPLVLKHLLVKKFNNYCGKLYE